MSDKDSIVGRQWLGLFKLQAWLNQYKSSQQANRAQPADQSYAIWSTMFWLQEPSHALDIYRATGAVVLALSYLPYEDQLNDAVLAYLDGLRENDQLAYDPQQLTKSIEMLYALEQKNADTINEISPASIHQLLLHYKLVAYVQDAMWCQRNSTTCTRYLEFIRYGYRSLKARYPALNIIRLSERWYDDNSLS